MPADSDILATGAASVELATRGRIAVEGRDRVSFLHAVLTNDIASLAPGQGCYAALLTPQGRMISDMVVLVLDDRIVLDAPAEMTTKLVDRFDRSIFSEDVGLFDISRELAAVGVFGPDAARIVGEVARTPALETVRPHHTRRVSVGGAEAIVARVEQEMGLGFVVYVPRDAADGVIEAVGALGAKSVHPNVLEVRRIEAGLPRFGVDMDEHTIPLEAGIEARAISFTKGCYPGQEVIIRVLHRGHGRVARKLVGLVLQGDVTATAGDPVTVVGADLLTAGGSPKVVGRPVDDEIGRVTSAVFSPSRQEPIALAYVRREQAFPGNQLSIVHDARKVGARVTALPFVDFSGRPHIKVVAAVIERDGRFLVTRRGPGVHLEGYWEFPGGKCEAAEGLEACLRRELREELGVEAVVSPEMLTVEHAYPERIVELRFFPCAIGSEPRPLLGQEMRWAAREELDELQFPPADEALIDRLKAQGSGLRGAQDSGLRA